MATALDTETPPTNTHLPNDPLVAVAADPAIVFQQPALVDDLAAALAEEIKAFVPDVTTDAGRTEIRKQARKVGTYATGIHDAGLKLTEEYRAGTKRVNEQREVFKSKLVALRAPLDKLLSDWNAAEDRRREAIDRDMATITNFTNIGPDITSEQIRYRVGQLEAMIFDPVTYVEGSRAAEQARADAIAKLNDALPAVVQREEERAELARLREAAEQREAADRAAERKRQAEEAAAFAEQSAQQRAQQEAAAKAQREIDAANARADQIEREAAAQRRREQEEADAKRAADEARQRDTAHREQVHAEAKAALIKCGIAERKAGEIVMVIAAGNVPHVSLKY